MPYIKKFGKHPITGRPITAKDLIRLTFHKNPQGEYMCPITYKAFTGTALVTKHLLVEIAMANGG
jgi:peptidyl-prolyl cis-trans isomerase-like protein 2